MNLSFSIDLGIKKEKEKTANEKGERKWKKGKTKEEMIGKDKTYQIDLVGRWLL